MNQFLSLLLDGLSLGALYALIALGFVILFKASEVVSFMQGSLLLLGAYLVARLDKPLGFWLGALVSIVLVGVAGLIVERLVIARLRGAPVISLAILTIGIDIIIATDLTRRIGSDILNVAHPWGGKVAHVGGVGLTQNRLISMLVSAAVIAALFAVFRFSSWGIAMRATAEDAETAALMGIRRGRVSMLAWVLTGMLAALAGLFLVGAPTPGVTPDIRFVAQRALPAAILGGLDSTTGALVGGLLIGVTESLTAGYQSSLLFLGRGFDTVVPYVVMLLVLLVRPSGLFGTRDIARV